MTFAAPLLPYITAGSALLSGFTQMQQASYQAAVANSNADLMAQQAQRETFAANQDIADQDADARAQVAALVSQMSASGINANSGSMLARSVSAESLAVRDRERLALKRDVQLENTKRQESTFRAEARASRRAGRLGLLGSFLSVPASYLSGASMLNDYNRGRMTLSTPSYMGGR